MERNHWQICVTDSAAATRSTGRIKDTHHCLVAFHMLSMFEFCKNTTLSHYLSKWGEKQVIWSFCLFNNPCVNVITGCLHSVKGDGLTGRRDSHWRDILCMNTPSSRLLARFHFQSIPHYVWSHLPNHFCLYTKSSSDHWPLQLRIDLQDTSGTKLTEDKWFNLHNSTDPL